MKTQSNINHRLGVCLTQRSENRAEEQKESTFKLLFEILTEVCIKLFYEIKSGHIVFW